MSTNALTQAREALQMVANMAVSWEPLTPGDIKEVRAALDRLAKVRVVEVTAHRPPGAEMWRCQQVEPGKVVYLGKDESRPALLILEDPQDPKDGGPDKAA